MAYQDHFKLVDDVSEHFDGAVSAVDAFLQSRYVGFYSVGAAAVIELGLKEIVIEFAHRNHPLFGGYVEAKYERINGRVKLSNIVDEHLGPFGEKFQTRFKRLLGRVDARCIRSEGYSVKKAYESLLTCRHKFAHEGAIPESASYGDVKKGYLAGKVVLACLAKTLE